MVNDMKTVGTDAALVHASTMPQVSVNINVVKTSPQSRSIMKRMAAMKEDPELAPMIEDISKHGPMAAFKYATDDALMKKLELVMGDLPAKVDTQKMNELMRGLGPLDEFYGEEQEKPKEWPHPRLLGGMQQGGQQAPKKKFGIISCLVCWCCFPCGLLACCFPLDEDKGAQ